MLRTLRIKNLAIVENLRAEFNPGLNVITGETGAGKSVITGALNLILGERADKTLIRAGEDTCGVEAVFELARPEAVNLLLEELGLPACEDRRLIVRRLISQSGSGKALVNDGPATLQTLARLGTLLVDMHGPHDHQSLLGREFQLDLLDDYGRLAAPRRAYQQAYSALLDLQAQRRALDGDDGQVAQQIEMLRYQIKEIEDAALTDADEEQVQQEHTAVANAQRIVALANALQAALTEDEASAFNRLAFCQKALDELAELLPEAAAWRDEARSAAVQIQELAAAIAGRAQSIEADPERLQWLEDRLALIHKLKRKYGGSIPEILKVLDDGRQRLRDLETRGERLAALERQIAEAEQQVQLLGAELGRKRRKAAKALDEAISAELAGLGFPHGRFAVELQAAPPGPAGLDEIEFGFAPNAGEPMRPLRAIASSGEISRVMLAIKSILAEHDRIPVLVFDEIDANVGGEMGNAIGARLAAIAATRQVLCVTHLPQVAARGRTHFVVRKEVRDGRTRTSIAPVAGEARVEELARMLGGRNQTSVTLKHARELLAKC